MITKATSFVWALLLLAGSMQAQAFYSESPNLDFVKTVGNSYGVSNAYAVEGTADGGSVVVCSFYGKIDIDPSGSNTFWIESLTESYVNTRYVMIKYNALGELEWHTFLDGDNFGGIAIDGSGNICTIILDYGGSAAFLAKHDSGGNLVWKKRQTGFYQDNFSNLAVDALGNIYITGYFNGTEDFNFDSGSNNMTSTGSSSDCFLAKYDPSGAFTWAMKIGGSGVDIALGLDVDAAGNVYVSGSFRGTVDFDPGLGTNNLTSAGEDDIFFAKYSPSAGLVWAKQLEGVLGNENASSLKLDASDNIYLCGTYQNSNTYPLTDFDPGVGVVNLARASGLNQYIAKYDNNGSYLWVYNPNADFVYRGGKMVVNKATGNVHYSPERIEGYYTLNASGTLLGSVYSSNYGQSKGISINTLGQVLFAGSASLIMDIAPGAPYVPLSGYFSCASASGSSGSERRLMYMACYSNHAYSYHVALRPSIGGNESVVSHAQDISGNNYMAGVFQGEVDFDPSAGVSILTSFAPTTTGGIYNEASDLFIAKYDHNGNYLWAKELNLDYSFCQQNVYVSKMRLDPNGNVYLLCQIRQGYNMSNNTVVSTYDLDPTANVYNITTSANLDNFFVQKYDSNGNFLWVKAFAGNAGGIYVRDFNVDNTGNWYVASSLYGLSPDLDPGPSTLHLTSIGNGDFVLAKYDSDGNFLWHGQSGSSGGSVNPIDITLNNLGELLVTGQSTGSTITYDLDFGAGSNLLQAGPKWFAARYSNSGLLLGLYQGNSNSVLITGIKQDDLGNYTMIGSVYNNIDLDPSPAVRSIGNGSSYQTFMARYTPNFNYISSNILCNGILPSSFELDSIGSSHIVFSVGTGFDFDNSTQNYYVSPSPSLYGNVIAKYDTLGRVHWARCINSDNINRKCFVKPRGMGKVTIAGNASWKNFDIDFSNSQNRLYTVGRSEDIHLSRHTDCEHRVQLQGNSNNIAIGTTITNTTDGTNFGGTRLGTQISKVFTIQNIGSNSNLVISELSSSNGVFTVSNYAPLGAVAPGGSASFTVTFSPNSAGNYTSTITVFNNDCSKFKYTFVVSGQGAPNATSLHFDGVDDYVRVASGGISTAVSLTMEAWVNPTSHGSVYNFICVKEGEFLMATDANGIFQFGISNTSPGWNWQNTQLEVPLNTWTHLAVSYDGIMAKAYKNGVLSWQSINSGTITDAIPAQNEFWIGMRQYTPWGPDGYWKGKLDEVRIWNRALSECEINQRFACEFSAPQSGLIAYYRFNQGGDAATNTSFSSLTDGSGNSRIGTLTNFALTGSTSNFMANGALTENSYCTAFTSPTNQIGLNNTNVLASANRCTENNWTYYRNSNNSNQVVFAINWAPDGSISQANQAAKDNSSVDIKLASSNDAWSATDPVTCQGTWLMGRYWDVNLGFGNSGYTALSEPVSVRFYINQSELNSITASAAAFSASCGRPVEPLTWFKTISGELSPASINANGIAVGNSIILTPTTGTTNGIAYREFTGLTSFSGGSVASGVGRGNPLPLELLSFEANKINNDAFLTWSITNELNTSSFEVQRSSDGQQFKTIGVVTAAGQSSTEKKYSYWDLTPPQGTMYYRLKNMDIDGSFDHSTIQALTFGKASWSAFPNPFSNNIFLSPPNLGEHSVPSIYEIAAYDLLGNIIHKAPVSAIEGAIQISTEDWPSGIYTISLISESETYSLRVIKD